MTVYSAVSPPTTIWYVVILFEVDNYCNARSSVHFVISIMKLNYVMVGGQWVSVKSSDYSWALISEQRSGHMRSSRGTPLWSWSVRFGLGTVLTHVAVRDRRPQTYRWHVLSPLCDTYRGGRAAASLQVGDRRNTNDSQVTQVFS